MGKKGECWQEVKKQAFNIDLESIKADIEDPKNRSVRKKLTDEEAEISHAMSELEKLKSIPPKIWNKIEEWGKTTGMLSMQQQSVAWNLPARIRNNSKISDYERNSGVRILDAVIDHAPQILFEIDNMEVNLTQDDALEYSNITM